jgi:antitoxin MazE
MQVSVAKWGNSLGLRVPRQLAIALGLADGAQVEVAIENDRLVVTPVRRAYTLTDLLKDTTPEDYRGSVIDWGPDIGRETVD